MQYDFEWDVQKARANRSRHGVTFEEAATAFQDPNMLTVYDGRHGLAEDRWATVGISAAGRILVVHHTFQDKGSDRVAIRIIFSRKATSRERRHYQES